MAAVDAETARLFYSTRYVSLFLF